ncbi:MAG: single-stranded-DNA-specific exonuclease RecJ [Candidatus Paceibacterota bacterium]|jgi:single-stranded-DNA-specific exonuclease
MQKRWLINDRPPESFAKEFPELSGIVLQLLWDRKICNQNLIDEFFNPDYAADIHDPKLLKDMDRAVARIFEALESEQIITVYGDYDVDGVTSSVIMVSTLVELKSALKKIDKKEAEKFIGIYIPDRELEGYGLNEKAINEIKKRKTDLIVTVDCGVSSFDNVNLVNELEMDIIITDHHHVPEKIPKAYAIINPKQKDCKYPFKELAGAGVAFKLAQGLIKEFEARKTGRELQKGFEKWLLDLVALGTVADCVELVGENRTLTSYGLLVINKTRRTGLKQLISSAGAIVRENGNVIQKKSIDSISISFMLAPRLNAAGRMDHANTSYGLLITDDEKEAKQYSEKLEKNNQSRQRLTEKMIEEIKAKIGKYRSMPKVIVETGKEWKIGIVGLVAGKLVDEFSRPFLILCKGEKDCAGSGRSIPEFNLIESIETCKDFLLGYGGHSQAAGLKIKNSNVKKLKEKLNSIADKILKEEDLVPSIDIDCEIMTDEINWQLVDEVEKFKPFGQANKKPVFVAKKLEVHEVRSVGSGNNHLKLSLKTILKDGSVKYFSAIGFRLGKFMDSMPGDLPGIRWGDIVDVAFQLEINQWNGNRELQMNIIDIKISGK